MKKKKIKEFNKIRECFAIIAKIGYSSFENLFSSNTYVTLGSLSNFASKSNGGEFNLIFRKGFFNKLISRPFSILQ